MSPEHVKRLCQCLYYLTLKQGRHNEPQTYDSRYYCYFYVDDDVVDDDDDDGGGGGNVNIWEIMPKQQHQQRYPQ